jgi:DNA-binding winged helix-turn-helix (wHTH) protein/predicted ATPase
VYRFGECELDVERRALRRQGNEVHLEPQAFDLLAALVEQRDRVVPKAELLDGVWGHQFLSDANLTTRIKEVRRAVGDDGARQHTIRNVRGRGYRFVAELAPIGPRADLVGRAEELSILQGVLRPGALVTIAGPGGVGKSTLARAAAANAGTATYLVDLGTLPPSADQSAALDAVAHSLDVMVDHQRIWSTLRTIAIVDGVLLLDNCEHVVDGVGGLAQQLTTIGERRLAILATSQVRLGLPEESILLLEPLSADAARALFDARVRNVRPNWPGEPPARVDALLAHLDRLPLTVEMAAARLASMSFDELERVVHHGAPFTQMTHRSPQARHRSLESLAAWSAGSLDERQRRRLMEMSVFAGRVSAADVVAVVAPSDHRDSTTVEPGHVALDVTADLAALCDHSLLTAHLDGPVTRYSMLSTVRAVAAGWLDTAGEAHQVHSRHLDYLIEQWDDIDRSLRTPHEADARDRATALVDEARSAHAWARRHDPVRADRLCVAMHHMSYSSLWLEPAAWAEQLLASAPDSLGARLLVSAAAAHRGDLTAAAAMAADVGTDEWRLAAIAAEVRADVALYRGELAAASSAASELQRLAEVTGDLHQAAFGAVDMALALAYGGRPMEALACVDEFLQAHPVDLAPSDRAWVQYARGDALSIAHDAGAVDAFVEALELGSEVGNRFVVSVTHTALATEYTRRGDHQHAIATYLSALADHRRHGNFTHAVTAMRNLIGLLVDLGDDEGAATLAGAMSDDRLRTSYGTEADSIAARLAEMGSRRSTPQVTGWFDRGRDLHVDEAIDVALQRLELLADRRPR